MTLRTLFRNRLLMALLVISLTATGYATEQIVPVSNDTPLFRNAAAPLKARVNDLIGRLTLEEKAGLLVMDSTAIPRLGIAAYHWWNECNHGVSNAGRATQFPTPIALAASWNPELIYSVASAVGDEMRAKHDYGVDSPQYHGLTCWGPTINMARDPRWGRTEETYGEDPYLTGQMAQAYIKGLQGDDPRYLKIAATPKHFAAYNEEMNREGKDVQVSERALREYYMPAFRVSVETGKAASLMMSYNGVNGIPTAINKWLMTNILRSEWGFNGVIVPDVSAPSHVRGRHHKAGSYPEVAARFIKAGGSLLADGKGWRNHLLTAVKSGLLREQDLDRPLSEVLTLRFRLGEFDPRDRVPYTKIPKAVIGSVSHQRLALQSAREGTVLLQNRPAGSGKDASCLLPLDRSKLRTITVIGPFANATYLGGYSGVPAEQPVTPLAGIREKAGSRIQVRLVAWPGRDKDRPGSGMLLEEENKTIRESDVVIAVMGLGERVEREGIDRKDLRLPTDQMDYLKQAYELNRRMVLVLENGGPVSDTWFRDNLPAVIDMWYPGERGGAALADVLFGNYNPSGRLPLTVYESEKQLPPIGDYEVSHGRTYRYLHGKPLYPFGHGESYTSFSYGGLKASTKQGKDGDMLEASIEISNIGQSDGDEVVQVYGAKLNPRHGQPLQQLLAFRRIHLRNGESQRMVFSVPVRELAYWDEKKNRFTLEGGTYEIRLGASSEDIRQRGLVELTAL